MELKSTDINRILVGIIIWILIKIMLKCNSTKRKERMHCSAKKH
jgi:large-conductance mechanosensitive channel